MKLAIVFLNNSSDLEELLSAFLEIGVSGATVVDSVGMGHIISQSIPIFAGLRDTFAGSSPNKKMVFAYVDEDMIEHMVAAMEDICNDDPDTSNSSMVILPIEQVYGQPDVD